MRLVVTGGGTGGHIYPALAIADKFKSGPETEILYIGNVEGIEK
ncbi:MAG: glycosyltransferase [Anaerovoracaceae bacterium]